MSQNVIQRGKKRVLERSLKQGALAFLDTAVMAIAGSAPAYSITASTAALVAAVGIAGPAALSIAFLPMIGITIAFSYLNLWRSDAGAAYAWVGRAIHPALGFIAGWALLSLSTIFMVAAALPAGEATLELVAPERLHDVLWATGIGAVWFLGVLALVTCGITATAKVQVVLTLLELGALILVSGLAIWNARAAPAETFSWDWFFPSAFGTFNSFCAGMLITIFYYFGWDVASNLAEETANAKKAAGTRRRRWRPRDRCPVPFGASRHPDGSDIRPDPGECRESASGPRPCRTRRALERNRRARCDGKCGCDAPDAALTMH